MCCPGVKVKSCEKCENLSVINHLYSLLMPLMTRPPPPFDFDAIGIQKRWTLWLQAFEFYLIASNKAEERDEVKIAILFNQLGTTGIELYNTLKSATDSASPIFTTYKEVIDAFTAYFSHKHNVIRDRLIFNKLTLQPGQPLRKYITQLKIAAATCGFQERDKMIRDRLIAQISDEDLLSCLLDKGDELSLDEATNICMLSYAGKSKTDGVDGVTPKKIVSSKTEINTVDTLEYRFFYKATQALKFKIKAANDAHIAITNGPAVTNPIYEVFLGGWGNSINAIRKNQEKPEVVEHRHPNTLSSCEFKEFWITWYDGTINVGLDDNPTPFLNWSDPNLLHGMYFGIRTGWGATGTWIIDDNWNGWRAPPSAPWKELRESPGWNLGPAVPIGSNQAKWVPTTAYNIPPDAVPGGFDNGQLYVGRASHAGSLTPGKVVPSEGLCYIPWGMAEHGISEYEVLTGCTPSWVPSVSDDIPPHAFQAGYSEEGEPLYIGRAQHNDTVTIGKVQKSHKVCYISYGGQEISKEDYEIMIL